jgi:hypothetical protein
MTIDRKCGFHPTCNNYSSHINQYRVACKSLPQVMVDLLREITIPVNFGILASSSNTLTLDQCKVQSQKIVDTLNNDYNNYHPTGGNKDLYSKVINEVFAKSNHSVQKLAIYNKYADAIPTSGANIKFVIKSVNVYALDQPIYTSDNTFGDDVKQCIRDVGANLNTPDTLSIWAVDVQNSDILGLSNFPWETQDDCHGVILALGVFYPPFMGPDSTNPYNLYKTAPHEVGHWLGLLHTFTVSEPEFNSYEEININNETQSSGELTGDFIADTPPQSVASSDPMDDSTISDMNNNPLFTDFMDYSLDKYLCIFTADQLLKVRYMISAFRKPIWTK